jgi:hypothetical protein
MLWLAALIFIATLIWRLPASWALGFLPAGVSCEQPRGTAWNGSCALLSAGNISLHDLRWNWLGGELLHRRVGVAVSVSDPQLHGSARLLLGSGGRLIAEQLSAQLPLHNSLLGSTATGLDGSLRIELPAIELLHGQATAATGAVQARDIRRLQPLLNYGNFEWQLAAVQNGRLSGPVRDLGGPLALAGTLALSLRGDFELNALLRARNSADPALTQAAELLGPADADGRHALSVSGVL